MDGGDVVPLLLASAFGSEVDYWRHEERVFLQTASSLRGLAVVAGLTQALVQRLGNQTDCAKRRVLARRKDRLSVRAVI